MTLVLALGCVAIWLYLALARDGFWRFATPPLPPTLPATLPPPAPLDARMQPWPAVVCVVPARDEAAQIGGCVRSLLAQDYAGDLRLVVVDDASSDGTAEVARAAARECQASHRLQVVNARTLPEGWSGKVWAQSEGLRALDAAQPAQDTGQADQAGRPAARYVWFTDADIIHRPGVLQHLVEEAESGALVLNSHMVHLRCHSRAEHALIPAFVFFFAMLYPFAAVNQPTRQTAAAAGGSMLVLRKALQAAGGLAAIRGALIDDCALAALMKRQGPIRLALGQQSFSIRAYPQWIDIWRMVSRTAYTQLGYSPMMLLGTVLGLGLTYVTPPVLALAAHGWPELLGALTWGLMALCFVPICKAYRRPLGWGLALPAIATFYLGATLGSAWQHHRGRGGHWKDRHQAHGLAAAVKTLDQPR